MMFDEYTREELVEEYIEQFVKDAFAMNGVLRKGQLVPNDVPTSAEYWKSRDNDKHGMHCEIARRYHLKREDIMWLSGIFDNWSDEMYIWNRKVKPLIRDAIRRLEAQENGRDFRKVKRIGDRWSDEKNGEVE